MPAPSAALAERGATSSPPILTMPASRGNTPVITLISVDLPAPFSPSSAWTSPARSVKSTSCNARTAPKLLLIPRTSSREAAESGLFSMTNSLPAAPADDADTEPVRSRGGFERDRRTAETRPSGDTLASVTEALLAVVDLLRIIGGRVELRLGLDPFRRNGALILEGGDGIERGASHVRRQLDCGIGFAGDHRLEDVGDRIDRDGEYLLARLEAGFLHRLDRADHHVVVVRINCADRLAAAFGLDEAFHHFLALGAGEVAGLAAYHLQVRMLGDGGVKTLLAVGSDAGADRALQFDGVAGLGADGLRQPVAGDLAFVNAVGGHGGEIELLPGGIDVAVEQHDRNLGLLGFFQHRVPAGRDDGREEDRIDVLRDEGADRLDLVLLFLLRVGDLEIDLALGGLLLGDRGLGRAPAGFRSDLREADGELGGIRRQREQQRSRGAGRKEGFRGHQACLPNVYLWRRLVAWHLKAGL